MDVDKLEEVDDGVVDDEEVETGVMLLLDSVEGNILEVVVLRSVVVLDIELLARSEELESELVVEDIVEELVVAATIQSVTTSGLVGEGTQG